MTDWQKRNLRLEVTHPKIQEMADAAQDLAKWYARGERLLRRCVLVLCGDSGTGKTHVSKSLYTWARTSSGRLGASVEWFSWPEACSAIVDEGFTGVIRDMVEADFLALDDIGAETDRFKTGDLTNRLHQVLSRRENQFTVVTTNIPPDKWNGCLDSRIADRFMRNSVVIDLSGVPSFSVAKLLQV